MPHGANSVIMKRYCIYIIMAVTALCVSEAVTAAQNEQEADSLFALPYNVTKTKGQVTGNLYQITGTELSRRVHGDLRGRMTGMIPGLEVIEKGL